MMKYMRAALCLIAPAALASDPVDESYVESITNDGMTVSINVNGNAQLEGQLLNNGFVAHPDVENKAGWVTQLYPIDTLDRGLNSTHTWLTKKIDSTVGEAEQVANQPIYMADNSAAMTFGVYFPFKTVTAVADPHTVKNTPEVSEIGVRAKTLELNFAVTITDVGSEGDDVSLGNRVQFDVENLEGFSWVYQRATQCSVACHSEHCSGKSVKIYGADGKYCLQEFVDFKIESENEPLVSTYSYMPFKWDESQADYLDELQKISCVMEYQLEPFEEVTHTICPN